MISIIVPIYNREKYLDECLSSILNQSYADFECILVNDGSTDNSENICKKFCDKDPRFKLFSQKNTGSSAARNLGIENSTGDFITFIDSDDSVETDFLKHLMHALNANNCDIAMCDLLVDGVRVHPNWSTLIMERKDVFHHYLWGGINNSVCTKLYKRELISDIYFHLGKNMMEDASYTSRVLEKCVRIARIDMGLYNYRTNQNSMVNSSFSQEKFLESNYNRIEKLKILFRNICGAIDEEKLSQDACEILRMIMFQTSPQILLSSSLYQDVVCLVNENFNVLKKYATRRTDKKMICHINQRKSPYMVKLRLSVNLMLENVLCKLK